MKKISLIILISLAAFFSSSPMGKTKMAAKPSAAMAVATAKLQAKPILFFDTIGMDLDIDYTTGKIIKASKSDEFTDLLLEYERTNKEISAKEELPRQEWNDICSKWSKGQITLTALDAAREKYDKFCTDINNEREALNAQNNIQHDALRKKIKTIKEVIAKRLNACAVLNYGGGGFLLIDPVYDITQEVFDTLNKEYKESQSKKHTCTHCCHAHCPKVH